MPPHATAGDWVTRRAGVERGSAHTFAATAGNVEAAVTLEICESAGVSVTKR